MEVWPIWVQYGYLDGILANLSANPGVSGQSELKNGDFIGMFDQCECKLEFWPLLVQNGVILM